MHCFAILIHSLQNANANADMTSDNEDADADKLLEFKKAMHAIRRKREARSAQATSSAVNDVIVLVSEELLMPLRL